MVTGDVVRPVEQDFTVGIWDLKIPRFTYNRDLRNFNMFSFFQQFWELNGYNMLPNTPAHLRQFNVNLSVPDKLGRSVLLHSVRQAVYQPVGRIMSPSIVECEARYEEEHSVSIVPYVKGSLDKVMKLDNWRLTMGDVRFPLVDSQPLTQETQETMVSTFTDLLS